ncbi:hypothetical protein BH09MYX1_BH09MYX1_35670 [soil metagenome]
MRSRVLVPALLVLSFTLAEGRAFAADPPKPTKQQIDDAMPHFAKGVELYDENDFAGALVEFKRAYEISKDWHILFNIAQASFQAQNYSAALTAFEAYLDAGGPGIAKDRKKYCDGEIEKLKGRVAKLDVVTNVPGADILVDDEKVGVTPLTEPLIVSQGKRKVTVMLKGRAPETKTIELAGRDSQRLEFELKEEDKAPPPPPIAVATHKKIPWVFWGITGGLAAGAIVTGVVALVFSSDAKSKLDTYGATKSEIDGAQTRALAMGITTDILIGCTAIAAGVSLVLTLTAKSEPAPQPQGAPTARLSFGPGSMYLSGTF